MGFFSPQRCTAKPAGIDITPYAMKKANGRISCHGERYVEVGDDVWN